MVANAKAKQPSFLVRSDREPPKPGSRREEEKHDKNRLSTIDLEAQEADLDISMDAMIHESSTPTISRQLQSMKSTFENSMTRCMQQSNLQINVRQKKFVPSIQKTYSNSSLDKNILEDEEENRNDKSLSRHRPQISFADIPSSRGGIPDDP